MYSFPRFLQCPQNGIFYKRFDLIFKGLYFKRGYINILCSWLICKKRVQFLCREKQSFEQIFVHGFLTKGLSKCSLQEYILKHCIQNIFSGFQILYSIVFIGEGTCRETFLNNGLCMALSKGLCMALSKGLCMALNKALNKDLCMHLNKKL